MSAEFILNGRQVSAQDKDAGSQGTLLDFLRARGLTGAKEGCAEGECGACAVVLVADHAGGRSAFRAVNSCLMPLALATHHEIYTVESLAEEGRPAPAQQVMAEAGGSQCGYCTPGFVMSLMAEQYRPDRSGPCEPLALAGNLCRCTGYRPIRDAALALGPAPAGALRDRLDRPAPRIGAVSWSSFSRPSTIEECVAARAAHPDAAVIAGGTDVGVEWNLHGKRWRHLISLEAVDELRTFSETDTSVMLGAALPLSEIGRRWSGAPQVVNEWLNLFASPLIRNRATLGGNLATASPIGDAAPLLLALDAKVHVAGPEGRRAIALNSFFTGYRKNALGPLDILTTIEIPKPLPTFVRFYKVAKRRLDDISTVAAAMAMDWTDAGRIERARFAFGGLAATPIEMAEAASAVHGEAWSRTAVERVQHILEKSLAPMSDHRGSRDYRLEVTKSLVEKFWSERPS